MHDLEVITVEWDADTRSWAVYARADPAPGNQWTRFEGAEGELDELLGLARDVVTGG